MRAYMFCLLMLASGLAAAHANGTSYLRITTDDAGDRIVASWDIAAADLQLPLELDADGDGVLTDGEILGRRAAIERFAGSRIVLSRGYARCELAFDGFATRQRETQMFANLSLTGRCPGSGPLEVSTELYFGSPGYSALLDVETRRGRFSSVLSMGEPRWFEPAVATLAETLLRFLREGFRHVLIGFDHVAFLLLLLLPSVLSRTRSGWAAATDHRAVLIDLVKVVSAFTIAHSVTLGLAATGTVQVPVQPIEIAIAGSIVVAGLLNLFPAASRWRLRLAFGFGFVHGFGFANALNEMDVGGLRVAPMLAGFNLGVEAAQVSIVALCLPVLWLLSRKPRYARQMMPALSVATAMTGAVWFVGRL